MSAISSRHTRSIAGASLLRNSAATAAMTRRRAICERRRRCPRRDAAGVPPPSARGRTAPAPRGRSSRASADRVSAAARCRAAARGDRSRTAGTGTGTTRTSAAPTASRDARRAAATLEHRLGHAGDARDAVVGRPLRSAARPARRHRSLQRLVQPQQVVRVAADRCARLDLQQLAKHGEVVLEIVDRVGGAAPAPARRAQRRPSAAARLLQLLRLRDAAGDRAHDVERVEARDARPRFADLEPRIRQPQPLGRRADREAQQQALGPRAVLLHRRGPRRSGARISRSSSIGSSCGRCGNIRSASPATNDDAEGAAARLLRPADEHAAVAALRRIDLEHLQPIRDDVARFVERDRTDLGHRPQLLRARAARAPAAAAPSARSPRTDPATRPTSPDAGHAASRSTIGSANARRCPRFRRSRSMRAAFGESGSSRRSASRWSRISLASPVSRRCHRAGSPPMTADSTMSVSHFHGARSVPSTMASSSSRSEARGSRSRGRRRRRSVLAASRLLAPRARQRQLLVVRRHDERRLALRFVQARHLRRARGTRRSGGRTGARRRRRGWRGTRGRRDAGGACRARTRRARSRARPARARSACSSRPT